MDQWAVGLDSFLTVLVIVFFVVCVAALAIWAVLVASKDDNEQGRGTEEAERTVDETVQ
jgi:heme/copper-type cytochrome/quinol oxidase subunit 2